MVTYREGGAQRVYAFVSASELLVRHGNGAQWEWGHRGSPPGQLQGLDGAITYREGNVRRIMVFCRTWLGQEGHLYVHHWNGSKWKWDDQGKDWLCS